MSNDERAKADPPTADRGAGEADRSSPPWRTGLVLGVGAVWLLLLIGEVSWANGPWYWKWPWRNLGWIRPLATLVAPLILVLASIPGRRESITVRTITVSVGLLAVANFALQILGMTLEPGGFDHLKKIVESPVATNYFGEAMRITSVRQFVAEFPYRDHGVHSGSHPPGTILYYWLWIQAVGGDRAAIAGGLALGLAGSAGVVLMYGFSSLWTSDPRSRILACALYAFLPALILFLPEFDQAFPLLSMGLLWGIVRSLEGRRPWTLLTGALLFVSTLFAYNLLLLGPFAVFYAIRILKGSQGSRAKSAWDLTGQSILVLVTFLFLHGILRIAMGYDAGAMFRSALSHTARIEESYVSPYFQALFWGPYDFFLGAGFMTLPLLGLFLYDLHVRREWTSVQGIMTVLSLATIAVIALSSKLPSETARLWLFLQPLVIVPCGIELARWSSRRIVLFIAVQWLVIVATKSKLVFISP